MKHVEPVPYCPRMKALGRVLALIVLGSLGILFAAPVLVTGCASSGQRAQIEAMDPSSLATVQARVDIITRVLAARLVESGKVSTGTIQDAATYLEIAAGDPLALSGPNAITGALARAGFTDQESILALMLVEDFLRSRLDLGPAESPLGPNARALLMTVADALRASAVGVTDEDQAKADAAIQEASNAR